MSREDNGDKAKADIADNPYMLNVDEFMELETQEKFELLLRAIANINQTLEAMGNDLQALKPKPDFVYAYTSNTPPNTPNKDSIRAK